MNQVLQNLKTGVTELAEIPSPGVKPGFLLIRTIKSVVSSGTEKMLVEFGKANLLEKARQQPDKVRQVLDKVKTDGWIPTLEAVRSKLDQPLPLGYSNLGVVLEVGKGVEEFSVGDRVVSNGPHAEIITVPKNLCAKVPDEVDDESAAFTVIASIGLQGTRIANPTLGETFVVLGMGLIGLLTVQLLKAQGCRVLGVDFDQNKLAIAEKFGVQTVDLSRGEDPVAAALHYSQGRGVDGVLITASTKSSEPVHQAALMCRKRGRIVLVGVTGLELSRADFYEKELSFQVSCSYGPGRYDPLYEEKGTDYPIGFVRWTEQRNFEAVLQLLAENKIDVQSLITHRFSIGNAVEAYETLTEGKSSLGIVLDYSDTGDTRVFPRTVALQRTEEADVLPHPQQLTVGLIGAGNYTNQILLPAIKSNPVVLRTIASSGGVNSVHLGKKYGFAKSTTDPGEIIGDEKINTVFITTRHDSHAHFVKEALRAGKHVFVEKPLCLTRKELAEIEAIPLKAGQILMVGFNRRFSPHVRKMKELLSADPEPKSFIMTVNAGMIPDDHWIHDAESGGGRVIGEACHYVDLIRFLAGSPITAVKPTTVGKNVGYKITEDKITFTLSFANGSIGTVHYFANGHKSYPKENLTVFSGGKILELNNFKELAGYGWRSFKRYKTWSQDKGHREGVAAFFNAIRNRENPPIPIQEIYEATKVCLDIAENQ